MRVPATLIERRSPLRAAAHLAASLWLLFSLASGCSGSQEAATSSGGDAPAVSDDQAESNQALAELRSGSLPAGDYTGSANGGIETSDPAATVIPDPGRPVPPTLTPIAPDGPATTSTSSDSTATTGIALGALPAAAGTTTSITTSIGTSPAADIGVSSLPGSSPAGSASATVTTALAGTTPATTGPGTTGPARTGPVPTTVAGPGADTAPAGTVPLTDLVQGEDHSFAKLNMLRQHQSIPLLTRDPTMDAYARDWSRHMAETGEFAHSPGPYGENIAFTRNTSLTASEAAEVFHRLWVDSPDHYANMTEERYAKAGIGLYRTSRGWYGTHLFNY